MMKMRRKLISSIPPNQMAHFNWSCINWNYYFLLQPNL